MNSPKEFARVKEAMLAALTPPDSRALTHKILGEPPLSQNRSLEDRQRISDGLTERTDDMSKFVQEMMIESENNK